MKAVVTGISGQDGRYMAELLASRGITVIGLTSRPVGEAPPGIPAEIRRFAFDEPGAIEGVIEDVRPDLVFNFAAKATGRGMFDAPLEMCRLNGTFALDILEAIRRIDPAIRLCQASSAEMYGDVLQCPQNEDTAFRPKSPYGAAKLYAHNLVGIYRNAFGLKCCSAILYNHESPRRPTAFVTRKIARAAAAIKLGQARQLSLGSLETQRDWGYAPEYVDAMFRMATADCQQDFVVATGRLSTIEDLCRICFSHVDLDYRDYLVIDQALQRPIETLNVQGDPSRIEAALGWRAEIPVQTFMREMVDSDLANLAAHPLSNNRSMVNDG